MCEREKDRRGTGATASRRGAATLVLMLLAVGCMSTRAQGEPPLTLGPSTDAGLVIGSRDAQVAELHGKGPLPPEMAAWDTADKERQRAAGQAFLKALAAAVQRGEKTFRAETDHYRFNRATKRAGVEGHYAYVNLDHLRDLVLDMQGSTFWFEDHICGIAIHDCHNLTVRNLFVDWDPLPYTQGTIIDFEANTRTLLVELDEGYERVTPRFQALVDPTRSEPAIQSSIYSPLNLNRLKLGFGDARIKPFWSNKVGPRTYRAQIAHPADFSAFNMEKGDRITMGMRTGCGIYQTGCERVRLEDVTLYASPCFAYFEVRGPGGNVYRHCKAVRRPGTNRLIGTNADGIHSSCMGTGPLIENCELESIHDDFINIHGAFASVLWQDDPTTLIVSRYSFPYELARQDLTLRLFRDKDLGYLGVCQTVKAEEIPWTVQEGRVFVFEDRRNPGAKPPYGTEIKAVRLSLREPVTIKEPTLAAIEDYVGRGTVIRNNHFRNSCVRGMLLHTLDALVEGNHISDTGREAVLMSPNTFWKECTFPRNIRIRNNLFERISVRTWHYDVPRTGVYVSAREGLGEATPSNIEISGNTFRDMAGAALVIRGARDVRITGNTIQGTHRLPSRSKSVTPEYVIELERAEDVELEGNVIEDIGPYGKGELTRDEEGAGAGE